jgi:hypothetical protein
MGLKREPSFEFETEWVRAYASAWSPSEAPFNYEKESLADAGVDLIDLRNLFRNGIVTYREKLEVPGAFWIVEGEDDDGNFLYAELIVISEEQNVTVRRVYKERRPEE